MTVRSDSQSVRIEEPVGHALGLDEQHAVERVARRGLEVRRLVDPGVAVPASAELLDDALHLVARDVGRALEVHVLDPMRDAGEAGTFVFRSDLVPAPDRCERRGMHLLHEHGETVIEHHFADGEHQRERGYLGGHGSIIRGGAVLAGGRIGSQNREFRPFRAALACSVVAAPLHLTMRGRRMPPARPYLTRRTTNETCFVTGRRASCWRSRWLCPPWLSSARLRAALGGATSRVSSWIWARAGFTVRVGGASRQIPTGEVAVIDFARRAPAFRKRGKPDSAGKHLIVLSQRTGRQRQPLRCRRHPAQAHLGSHGQRVTGIPSRMRSGASTSRDRAVARGRPLRRPRDSIQRRPRADRSACRATSAGPTPASPCARASV